MKNDILQPAQSYSKMRKIEPRYHGPRYNEIPDITNAIQKPKRKIYRTTNKCHHATKAEGGVRGVGKPQNRTKKRINTAIPH